MHQNLLTFLREAILNLLIPAIYLGYLVIVFKTGNWPTLDHLTGRELVTVFTLVLGLVLWGISYLYVAPTIYLSLQTTKLVTSGPYRFLRHPIYAGALLVFLSLSYLSHSWTAFGYTIIIILPINLGRALWEEKILLEVFGDQYRRYQKKTLF